MESREDPRPNAYSVLVVDEASDSRDELLAQLEERGYRVLVAQTGAEALDRVGVEAVDLVLLDVALPGIPGLEVLRRIREGHDPNTLRVLMTSAEHGSHDVVEALKLGANDFVGKPLDLAVVAARIEAQLRTLTPPASREPEFSELGPGVVLDSKYSLDECIGDGTFGTVYRATHVKLHDAVAIKVLKPSVTAGPAAVARFRREGISICRLEHPNAVAVRDFGVTKSGVAYLVMEFLEGVSLAGEIEGEAPLSLRRSLQVLQPICDVLAEAHDAGIVHRDIKPENIFLHRTPRGEVIKVLDFGLAKLADTSMTQNLTAEGSIVGTPTYMAPERITGNSFDGRSDVYSLGVMAFAMLTGRLPFVAQGRNLISILTQHVKEEPPALLELRPELPVALGELVKRALAKSPDQRPSATAFAHQFANAIGNAEEPDSGRKRRVPVADQEPGEATPTVLVERRVSSPTQPLPAESRAEPGLGAFLRRTLRRVWGGSSSPR